MSSPRALVLEAFCDALEPIGNSGLGTWETTRTVTSVNRRGMAHDAQPTPPFIEINRVSEAYTLAGYSGTAAMYSRTMTIDFSYVTEGWDSYEQLGQIVSDVETALGADHRLGSTCTSCFLASNNSAVNSAEGSVNFTATIIYRTSDKAPTVRV